MLLKAVLVAAMTMSAPQPSNQSLDASPISVFDSNAPATTCASEAVGVETETSGTSSCAAAQANYDAVSEEYWWAYNNLTAAVQVYSACTENCGFWEENVIYWSNYFGQMEYALQYAWFEVDYYCNED